MIGRFANRIAKGTFSLDGHEYHLPTNNGPNSLHGGKKGFNAVAWKAEQAGDCSVRLTYLSKDGEEGYPGNLSAKITVARMIRMSCESITKRQATNRRR